MSTEIICMIIFFIPIMIMLAVIARDANIIKQKLEDED